MSKRRGGGLTMSLEQQHLQVRPASAVPTLPDALVSALGSVRAEGLAPDAEGMALLQAVAAGELSVDEAIGRAGAVYAA